MSHHRTSTLAVWRKHAMVFIALAIIMVVFTTRMLEKELWSVNGGQEKGFIKLADLEKCDSSPSETGFDPNATTIDFTIIVLTMDRFDSLNRVLKSLKKSDYLSDHISLIIRFDVPIESTQEWKEAVKKYQDHLDWWPYGPLQVVVAPENMGLRGAWLNAWSPLLPTERAIIFEDDVEVSPAWYQWIRGAHTAYQNRTDLAGISLQRQTLIPLKATIAIPIPDNEGLPFLYRLVGSIGFSPRADAWLDFLSFAECALASSLDPNVPVLITSDWYRETGQRAMWTQLFIFFCAERNLYTLYNFPSNQRALMTHWREKGEPPVTTAGRDFELAKVDDVSFDFPTNLVKLDWDARPSSTTTPSTLRSVILSAAVDYSEEEFSRFVTSIRSHYKGDITLLVADSISANTTHLLARNNIRTITTSEKGGKRHSPEWERVNQERWSFYVNICKEETYDLCMTVDFRDVLFQDDPFRHVAAPSSGQVLHLFLHNLVMNDWHLSTAIKCANSTEGMKGVMIINAGSIIATPSALLQLKQFIRGRASQCQDQVALNLGVYSNALNLDDTAQVIFHLQGEGSVNNVAYDGVFRRDSRGRFLNHDCFPAAVVHQFDIL